MRVGLTFDLRAQYLAQGFGEEETAEFDSAETIEAIDAALRGLGFETERIGNLQQLARSLVLGNRWDLVFNIAEGLHGVGREAQVPALLDAYGIPYTFSDPLTMALTLDKAMAKRVVRDHGLPTAPFAVVESERDCAARDLPFPVFVKPLAEGTGKGITAASRVEGVDALAAAVHAVLTRFRQPALVESFLPGREFTVGILGAGATAEAIGVMEVDLLGNAEAWGYGYENKEHYESRVAYRLVDDAEARRAAEVALGAWRALRCRDGGRVDLRSDAAGAPNFLEVNPLAGLHPVRSDLVILARQAGIAHDALIGRIVDACLARLELDRAAPDRPLAQAR